MLSTLPKFADKAFIVGFFIPAIIFSLCELVLFSGNKIFGDTLKAINEKDFGGAVIFAVAVWILSVLLATFNIFLYKIFEGYVPPFQWGIMLRGRTTAALEQYQNEAAKLYDNWTKRAPFTAENQSQLSNLLRGLAKLPTRRSEILPTEFGNSIKAFEVYAREVYGADAIPIWIRLSAVAPKALLEDVQDARSKVDFMLNSSMLAILFGISAFGYFIYLTDWNGFSIASATDNYGELFGKDSTLIYLAASGVAIALSFIFYRGAVILIPAWGDVVKAIFDLSLPELAKTMGYVLPANDKDRRSFWDTASRMMTMRTYPGRVPIHYPEDWVLLNAPLPKSQTQTADAVSVEPYMGGG